MIQGIRIHRVSTYSFGTLGYVSYWDNDTNTRKLLTYNGLQVWAAEPTKFTKSGEANVYQKTCIPKGNYFVNFINSEKWRLLDVPDRDLINIEVFNKPANESLGCITLGVNPTYDYECKLTLENTRNTIKYVYGLIPDKVISSELFQVDIVENQPLGNWYGCKGYIGGILTGTYFQDFVKDLRNNPTVNFTMNYGIWVLFLGLIYIYGNK